MAIKDSATLKGYFNAGDIPTEENFVDLIDSTLIAMPSGSLIYRKTDGEGRIEFQSLSTLKSDLLLRGQNFGDVTLASPNHGLSLTDQVIGMGTPSSVSVSSSNGVVTSSHTHAVVTSSNPGAAASILASSVDGYLRLVRLGIGADPLYPLHVIGEARIDGDLIFIGSQSLKTSADNLILAPAVDLDLSPGGTARVRLTSGVKIQSDNYASQTTGWGISYSGAGDFRYLFTDELHAKSFIVDLEQALAGAQIISKSVALLAEDFNVPVPGGHGNMVVESFKGFDTFRVFVDGDIVRLRQFDRTGTELTIANCWGTVVWVSTDTTTKTQTYTFTRSEYPDSGIASGTILAGTVVLDYGTTGNGFVETTAIDGLMAENAPYQQIVSWTEHPNRGQVVRSRLGNLKGIFNVPDEYGLYAGSGVTDSDKYIRISNQVSELHNISIKLFDGAVNTVLLSPTVPSFAMGSTLPESYGTGIGIWMGKDSTTYKFRVGDPATGGQGIFWDGTNLSIKGTVTITSISGLNYAASSTPGGAASTLANQGALATKSSVDLTSSEVTNKSLANLDSTASTKLGGIAAGATVGATWGTNLSGIPTTLGTPSGSGLFLSSTYMGYYTAGAWKTYIANDGKFYFAGNASNYISWNGTTMDIRGAITITGGSGYANLSDRPTTLAAVDSAASTKLEGIDEGADVTASNTSYDTARVNGLAASKVSGWAHTSNTTYIDGGHIYTDTVTADQIYVTSLSALSANMGTITAGTITGATIRTAASAPNVVLNASSIVANISTSKSLNAAYSFAYNNVVCGSLYAYRGGQYNYLYLANEAIASTNGAVVIEARTPTLGDGFDSSIALRTWYGSSYHGISIDYLGTSGAKTISIGLGSGVITTVSGALRVGSGQTGTTDGCVYAAGLTSSGSAYIATTVTAAKFSSNTSGTGGGIMFNELQIYRYDNNGSGYIRTPNSIIIDGYLGIGTTSLWYPLSVYNSSGDTNVVLGNLWSNAAASGTSRTSIRLYKGASGYYGGEISGYLTQSVGGGLIFSTINDNAGAGTAIERMRIHSNGCIGIGTASPLAKLSVEGGAHIGGTSDPGDNNLLVDGTITTANMSVNGTLTTSSICATHTWTQLQSASNAQNIAAYYAVYSSYNMISAPSYNGNYFNLISTTTTTDCYVRYKLSGLKMSSLYISVTFNNSVDATSRTCSLMYTLDGTNWVQTTGTLGSGDLTLTQSVNFGAGYGGCIQVQFKIHGGLASAGLLGIRSITFQPTAASCTFITA